MGEHFHKTLAKEIRERRETPRDGVWISSSSLFRKLIRSDHVLSSKMQFYQHHQCVLWAGFFFPSKELKINSLFHVRLSEVCLKKQEGTSHNRTHVPCYFNGFLDFKLHQEIKMWKVEEQPKKQNQLLSY